MICSGVSGLGFTLEMKARGHRFRVLGFSVLVSCISHKPVALDPVTTWSGGTQSYYITLQCGGLNIWPEELVVNRVPQGYLLHLSYPAPSTLGISCIYMLQYYMS